MVRGLYAGYSGMIQQQQRLDTITNNLANASTVGYKREGATTRSFEDVMAVKIKDSSVGYEMQRIGTMELGVKIGENYTDYNQGSLRQTENPLDLALEGNGFFAISFANKNGEEMVKYTRDGSFTMDADGCIRTKDGDYLLNDSGTPIEIPTDTADLLVSDTGKIYADRQYIDTIGITDFENYDYLKKYGENMYTLVDGGIEQPANATIAQGYLEMSNINVVSEMVEMISITRAYEANQKAIHTADSMLDKSVNSIGTVS